VQNTYDVIDTVRKSPEEDQKKSRKSPEEVQKKSRKRPKIATSSSIFRGGHNRSNLENSVDNKKQKLFSLTES
jgi:hypothetical protein